MNNEELKEALISRTPIIANIPLVGEVEYSYVSAIIYRKAENGSIYIEAEVMDKCSRSVLVINPKYISFKEELECQ